MLIIYILETLNITHDTYEYFSRLIIFIFVNVPALFISMTHNQLLMFKWQSLMLTSEEHSNIFYLIFAFEHYKNLM